MGTCCIAREREKDPELLNMTVELSSKAQLKKNLSLDIPQLTQHTLCETETSDISDGLTV